MNGDRSTALAEMVLSQDLVTQSIPDGTDDSLCYTDSIVSGGKHVLRSDLIMKPSSSGNCSVASLFLFFGPLWSVATWSLAQVLILKKDSTTVLGSSWKQDDETTPSRVESISTLVRTLVIMEFRD